METHNFSTWETVQRMAKEQEIPKTGICEAMKALDDQPVLISHPDYD